jgi:hypothetical protein
MFLRGINYDVGTPFRKGRLSRPGFDETIVRKEIEIIRNDLRCDSIRISGYDPDRLSKASEFALEQGLQVWFSPVCVDATQEEALEYLTACAVAAEQLRKKRCDLIFVIGCEYSLFLKGIIKGNTLDERIKRMFNPAGIILNSLGLRKAISIRLNSFLKTATEKVREHFTGRLSYASGIWENVDWRLFDIVGIDHYRASYNKSSYVKQLSGYYKFNKPVAVLEFGCCTYRGAENKGGAGWAIIETTNGRPVLKGNYVRDESVQADHIMELLEIFENEKLYSVFVFTFINPSLKFNSDPRYDLDMASYGIVKPVDDTDAGSYKNLPWKPKDAFNRLAVYYSELYN